MAGWRAKLGFLIPAVNPTAEQEMYRLAPEGVSVHFARMVARGPVGTLDNLQSRHTSQLANLGDTVEMLAAVKPDVIVLAHTATSYMLGKDGEAELVQRMQAQTSIPFISALGSAVLAFGELGVRRIAIGTAYDEALTQKSKASFEARGLEVVNAACLPNVRSIFEETEDRVCRLMRQVDRPEAEGLFISGVGLPTLSVLGALESDLGRPVLSSASAMMWNALRTAGVAAPIAGFGRLLEDPQYRRLGAVRRG
jgi:maleate cis-trans isomerase